MAAEKTYQFKARIQQGDGGGAYVFFPYDVKQEFGTTGRVQIRATFDGEPYSGSMVKYGAPQHMLIILKAIREKIGKQAGDEIDITVVRDYSERTIEVPDDFRAALTKAKLLSHFEQLAFTHRKEYVKSITDAKREETRVKRIDSALKMIAELAAKKK